MKLAPLLAQYLYSYKRVDLPGIGTFYLGNAEIIELENSKYTNSENISFENNSSIKESPSLINFISSHTGKMKALAMADLESHLELARQFLNIGKPFLFEGIGSLVKIRSGEFAFTSGETVSEKIKEYSAREISSTSSTEESFANIYPTEKRKWRKTFTWFLLLAGIGLAIWGGYTVYERTVNKDTLHPVREKQKETIPISDSLLLSKEGTNNIEKTFASTLNYKFVVEVANRQRGADRFNALKGYGLDIKMETTDSIHFKLLFLLPATAIDTSRILDSLKHLYTPSWGKAFVED